MQVFSELNLSILITAYLAAASASLLGVLLVLRKLSLIGDAISHAILPGIVLAFLFSQSKNPQVMLIGAGTVGLITTLLIEWITKAKIAEDSSIGIVFTVLFAIGVVLISLFSRNIDLDAECVLFGELSLIPLQEDFPAGSGIPRSTFTLSIVYLFNILLIILFYKEWKISTFDSTLAATLGFSTNLFHYLLMSAVSLTTVAGFEATGAILIVSMFIGPALIALIAFHKLSHVFIASQIISLFIALFGYISAKLLDSSIAGAMTTITGLMFAGVIFLSPHSGLLIQWIEKRKLEKRIALEDLLGLMYRLEEKNASTYGLALNKKLIKRALSQKFITPSEYGYQLSKKGRQVAANVIRSHRLWESYLEQELQLPPDHTHQSADIVEHFLSPQERENLSNVLKDRNLDPQGKPIPKEASDLNG
ncbi:MAG: metal ABC transporter permease [bacterium]|nr:metal ABC transporter permease [bacterium]